MTIGEPEQPRPLEPTLEQSLDEALGDSPSPDSRRAEERPVAHLVVVGGPETGRLIRLGSRETVLGRSLDVAGKLNDPSASQRHAKVLQHDNGYVLVDLGSTNGTHLNEERLQGPVLLAHGDTIRIGTTRLRFLYKGAGGGRSDKTVPIEAIPDPSEPLRRNLVRYRDARLTPWGPRDFGDYDEASGQSTDWLVYVRAAVDYVKRYGAFVGAMALVGACGGMIHAWVKPPLGSAYFEISLSREAGSNPVDDEHTTSFFVAAERTFRSTRLIKESLRRLGVEPRDDSALAIQRRVAFSSLDKQERVWRGEYEGRNAEEARAFLAQHLEVYLERELDKTLHGLKAQIDLLERQLARSGEQLRETEEELAAFKKDHPGVVGVEGTEQYAALGSLQARRDELAAQIKRLGLELRLNRKRLDSGDALLQGRVSSSSSYTSALQEVEKQISEAKAQGLGEQHPKLKSLRAKARELRNLMDSTINAEATEVERRSNEAYVTVRERVRDLEVAVQVAQTELDQVNERLRKTEDRVTEQPEVDARFAKLTRNYASTKALHDRLYQKLQASRIQLRIEQETLRARYDLLTPPTPEPPNMTKAIAQRSAVGGVGTFFLAVLCAGVREALRYLRSVL